MDVHSARPLSPQTGRGDREALSRAEVQRDLTRAFAAAGIGSAGLDARLILCAALGIEHIDLVREPEHPIGPAAAALASLAQRRIAGEPVSRIVGRREFYGLAFDIGPAVLDPRPDTEVLVEAALGAVRPGAALRVLDFGVGSGAILAALLSRLPNAYGIGVDCSEAACHTARRNLTKLGFAGRSSIVCGDWGDSIIGRFDLIVANPPYISSADIADLAMEVRKHDPHMALDGGPDGLAAYRLLAPVAARLVVPGGFVALELGAGQAGHVAALLDAAGLEVRDFQYDLAGHIRVVIARGHS